MLTRSPRQLKKVCQSQTAAAAGALRYVRKRALLFQSGVMECPSKPASDQHSRYHEGVRIFHGRLRFDKDTDRKYRWVTDVDGVKFQLYIQDERVAQPVSDIIEVSIFADKQIYHRTLSRVGSKTVADLTQVDKDELATIGLTGEMLRTAGATAILGGVQDPKDHTQTYRYNAFRHDPPMAFGDPYIPKSVFRRSDPPNRLLFLVKWTH